MTDYWKTHHISRSFTKDPFAPACGCELAPCGLVIPKDGCQQHGEGSMKTIRDAHSYADCPKGPICGLCGQKAKGFATIGDTRYCHGGDQDDLVEYLKSGKIHEPTCYEIAMGSRVHLGPEDKPGVAEIIEISEELGLYDED